MGVGDEEMEGRKRERRERREKKGNMFLSFFWSDEVTSALVTLS